MSTSLITKKVLAAAAVTGLTLGLAPFAVAPADAATVNKTINASCRTNGAPMKYNVTRPQTGQLTLTTPDQAKAGENVTVRMNYQPEKVPGKESIATMVDIKDIVLRFTIDNPDAFVTAKIAGPGRNIEGNPNISLVGGKTLVLSGFRAPINGKDTEWAPPAVELTFKAPTDAKSLPTLHPAVEGPAGEFNNPANFLTMKSTTDTSILGSITVALNCQALSGPNTLASIPVIGGSDKPADKKADKKDAKKGDKKDNKADKKDAKDAKGDDQDATANETATTDENGLTRVDTDSTQDTDFEGESSLSGGAIAGIVILVLLVAGGIGYGVYRARKKKKA